MNIEDLKKYALFVTVVPIDEAKNLLNKTPLISQTKESPKYEQPPQGRSVPVCDLCQTELRTAKNGKSIFCPNFKDKSKGEHTFKRVSA